MGHAPAEAVPGAGNVVVSTGAGTERHGGCGPGCVWQQAHGVAVFTPAPSTVLPAALPPGFLLTSLLLGRTPSCPSPGTFPPVCVCDRCEHEPFRGHPQKQITAGAEVQVAASRSSPCTWLGICSGSTVADGTLMQLWSFCVPVLVLRLSGHRAVALHTRPGSLLSEPPRPVQEMGLCRENPTGPPRSPSRS